MPGIIRERTTMCYIRMYVVVLIMTVKVPGMYVYLGRYKIASSKHI